MTNVTAPASASAPWLGTNASATKNAGGEEQQQQAGDRDRQHLEPVEPDEQRDRADRAGEDQAGVPELDEDPHEAEREHQRDDVRVDQEVERALPEAHLDPLDLAPPPCGGRALSATVFVPSIFSSSAGTFGAITSTMFLRERLAGAEVGRLPHHRLGRLGVPPVLARELAHVRGGVVDDLPAQVLADVLAGRRDRRRRADVRLRRHREDVRGLADHGARRSRRSSPAGAT